MDKKKCWCYLTYVFSVDDVSSLPFPKIEGVELLPSKSRTPEPAEGFEPTWFFNSKFPEDEEAYADFTQNLH